MNVKGRPTLVIPLPNVPMNVDPIHANVGLVTLEMDLTVVIHPEDPVLRSRNTLAVSANTIRLTQMAMEDWHHSQCTVTWQIRRVLAWQSSVTTVRAGQMWEDMKIKAVTKDAKQEGVTHVTFTTLEWACLVSQSHRSFHTLWTVY